MEDTIKTTRIDVDKIDNIFDEILTFIMDTDKHDTQEDCLNRVKIADMIFTLASETIYKMMDTTCNYRYETGFIEFSEQIKTYEKAFLILHELKKLTNILQG